jgi:hypothetical protein
VRRIRGQELVEQALALDPDNGDAYLERAHLASFDDLAPPRRITVVAWS